MNIHEHNFVDFIINSDGLSCHFENKITTDQKLCLLAMARNFVVETDQGRVLERTRFIWSHTGEIAWQIGFTTDQLHKAINGLVSLGVILHFYEKKDKFLEIHLTDFTHSALRRYCSTSRLVERDSQILKTIQDDEPSIYNKTAVKLIGRINRPSANGPWTLEGPKKN